MTHALHVQLLGGFHLLHGDEFIDVRSVRIQALLAYLLLHRHGPQPRQQIAAHLWPDSRETQARANLRKLLHQLKKTVPQSDRFLQVDTDALAWRAGAPYSCDVVQFEEATARAGQATGTQQQASLERAVDLYRGDLLPACYDEWIWPLREQLRQTHGEALYELVRLLEARRAFHQAIRFARQLCRFDPLREASHRQLMRLYWLSGDRARAIEAYRRCKQLLRDELAVEPGTATRDLYAQILDDQKPKQPRHNLPQQLTSFVGRADELSIISQRLQDENCRLLTLVGPGGIGKTRLAVQAASQLVDRFEAGVSFVSLEPVSSPDLLVAAFAEALNVSFYEPHDLEQQLLDYLRQKQLLLVLDNFEHLLDAAGWLVDLLERARSVKLLVTSRERLKLPQEWLFQVGGLPGPEGAQDERFQEYGAVQLFLQRARKVRSPWTWTTSEKEAVAHICRQLEGMPLGIELAAAWLRVFSVREIASELSRNLDVVARLESDLPPKHHSLRAVFEQSWQFLSQEEQELWAKLAVFQGPFDRGAAGVVAEASPSSLMALVDKSLLRLDGAGLFSVHGLLRQYGLEKLSERPQTLAAARAAHGQYYARYLDDREDALVTRKQQQALAEIAGAIDDIRFAWEWAVSQDQHRLLSDAAGALARFYEVRGWFEEGSDRYARAVVRVRSHLEARSPASDEEAGVTHLMASLLARLLIHEGFFRLRRSDFDGATARLQESISIAGQFGARSELATATTWLAEVCYRRGEYARARQLCRQALDHSRPLQQVVDSVRALSILGQIEFAQGRFQKAQRFFAQSRELCAELGDSWALAHLHNNLGMVAHELGGYQKAWNHFQTSLDIFSDLDDRWGRALVTNNMGQSALLTGRLDEAQAWLEESLALRRDYGNRWAVAFVLNNLARLSLRQERYAQARAHAEESLAIRRQFKDRQGVSSCLINLGDIALAMNDAPSAQRRYLEGLRIAVEIHNDSLTVAALLGIARVLSEPDHTQPALALELARLVATHPATTDRAREEAQGLAAELDANASHLPSEEPQRHGSLRPLESVVADLLVNLS
jgi:predicted ATPase/DNA-binding SARP family transcriptional activator